MQDYNDSIADALEPPSAEPSISRDYSRCTIHGVGLGSDGQSSGGQSCRQPGLRPDPSQPTRPHLHPGDHSLSATARTGWVRITHPLFIHITRPFVVCPNMDRQFAPDYEIVETQTSFIMHTDLLRVQILVMTRGKALVVNHLLPWARSAQYKSNIK